MAAGNRAKSTSMRLLQFLVQRISWDTTSAPLSKAASPANRSDIVPAMPTVLSWVDHSEKERRRMRRVLKLLVERNTIDELGLAVLRDGFADAFFPGTSTIQTRLKYFLFVPWIYRRLEEMRARGQGIDKKARELELGLIEPLKQGSDGEGIFGVGAGQDLVRLPSEVYWGGLVRWGILRDELSRGQLHAQWEPLKARSTTRPDDPGVRVGHAGIWHARLPKGPLDKGQAPPGELSFDLSGTEAEFLQGRILQGRGPGRQQHLLAWLAEKQRPIEVPGLWDLPVPSWLEGDVVLARRFSAAMHGAALLYNLMAAERSTLERHRDKDLPRHRRAIGEWGGKAVGEGALKLRLEDLQDFAQRRCLVLKPGLIRFLAAWLQRLGRCGPERISKDKPARRLIQARELQLKPRERARLTDTRALNRWGGSSGANAMIFRWTNVQRQMRDLYDGLGH